MKIDKGQKTQFIILCCLIAVALVVGVRWMVGKGIQAASRGEKQPQAVEQKVVQPEQGEAAGNEIAVESSESVSEGVQRARDPFEPQVVPKAEYPGSGSQERASASAAEGSKAPLPLMPPLIAQTVSVDGPVGSGPQALRLTGVVVGPAKVAIIRGPENMRHIVREGERIGGKFVVESISRSQVRLRSDDNTIVLRLGDR